MKYSIGATGGEAEYKLTVAEMPSHNHKLHIFAASASTQDWVLDNVYKGLNNTDRIRIENEGGDQAHNNMPPYLAVSIWKRTA